MSTTVDALLPLSFLHAVRRVDTPDDDSEAEYATELRNKRLGLSETVYAQIQRYSDAARRNQRPASDEATALARLIGRRPDAEAVFREAGRHLAREAYATLSAPTRRALRTFPRAITRPVALRRIDRVAQRYLDGRVRRVGASLILDVPSPITLDSAPQGRGCCFYEASLRELVLLTVGTTGTVEHIRCTSRGEGGCEWKADWR
jgi:hypothetical protein